MLTMFRRAEACVGQTGAFLDRFWAITFRQNSKAHRAFVDMCAWRDDDKPCAGPIVTLTRPNARVDARAAPNAAQDDILYEAGAVVLAYADLCPTDLPPGDNDALPALGPPTPLPAAGVVVRHPSVCADRMIARIASGAACPTIAQQRSGTVLCGVQFHYANAVVSLRVVKRP